MLRSPGGGLWGNTSRLFLNRETTCCRLQHYAFFVGVFIIEFANEINYHLSYKFSSALDHIMISLKQLCFYFVWSLSSNKVMERGVADFLTHQC